MNESPYTNICHKNIDVVKENKGIIEGLLSAPKQARQTTFVANLITSIGKVLGLASASTGFYGGLYLIHRITTGAIYVMENLPTYLATSSIWSSTLATDKTPTLAQVGLSILKLGGIIGFSALGKIVGDLIASDKVIAFFETRLYGEVISVDKTTERGRLDVYSTPPLVIK